MAPTAPAKSPQFELDFDAVATDFVVVCCDPVKRRDREVPFPSIAVAAVAVAVAMVAEGRYRSIFSTSEDAVLDRNPSFTE
jgi:hypothetical protein